MKIIHCFLLLSILLAACTAGPTQMPGPTVLTATVTSDPSATPTAPVVEVPRTGNGKVPAFDHIVMIVLENHSYDQIIGNPDMPFFNQWARQYVLLTHYYAIRHPSLPNYLALIGGDTFGITKDCIDCFLNQVSLPDLIEKSGRTWKTYQEHMPTPCYVGNADPYVQKHNPFMYFDAIRNNSERCQRSVVPMTQMDADLESGDFPNFAFIMPDMCNSGHDCDLSFSDDWLSRVVTKLQLSDALGSNSLIIITYDEADDKKTETCCGLGKKGGGQIATLLISPQARPAFEDTTEMNHYSLLKTILQAWGLPDLGNTAQETVQPIKAPWQP